MVALGRGWLPQIICNCNTSQCQIKAVLAIHRHRRTGSSPQSRRASQEKRQAILKMDPLVDDPHQSIPFLDGTLAFAGSGKNSRREEVFLSLGHQR